MVEQKQYIIELFSPPLKISSNATRVQRIAALNALSKKIKTPIISKLDLVKGCVIIDHVASHFTIIIKATEEAVLIIVKFPEVRTVILDKHHK